MIDQKQLENVLTYRISWFIHMINLLNLKCNLFHEVTLHGVKPQRSIIARTQVICPEDWGRMPLQTVGTNLIIIHSEIWGSYEDSVSWRVPGL